MNELEEALELAKAKEEKSVVECRMEYIAPYVDDSFDPTVPIDYEDNQ